VYHREGANNKNEILLLDPTSGAAPSMLNAGTVSRQPTASANGSRVAFAVSMLELGTSKPIDDIFAVDRSGMNMKQLTNADGVEDHPAWSPTAARIAYRHITPQATRTDIWVMNADGTGQTNLTSDFTSMVVGPPSWSPDGSRIAFATSQLGIAGTTTGIWTMNADGSDKKMLTSTLTGFDGSPTWSSDGQRIAFIRFFAGDADIAFVSSAGGSVTRLPLAGNQAAPAWSPDGRLIAFTQADGTRSSIYTVRPDGSELALRTANPAWGGGSEPAWIARP
jgi:TolB protein